ncbi:hypothetical protein BZG36_02214 [Bifiguratus adelaidae]|uniref:J domain-containing protein n=1 Tax=Bifiguratus adelaidae TaxID=1938954 RepID=A0A261Y3W6_9FUNG|nr:hypothetical protein BZG36_02214 [Bifiguratus adelaidae]
MLRPVRTSMCTKCSLRLVVPLLERTYNVRVVSVQRSTNALVPRPVFGRHASSTTWTKSSTAQGEGPEESKIRAVPFRQHPTAADETFERYHGHNFFSAKPQQAKGPVERYLPFWVGSAKIRARITQAQVGRDITRTVYNPRTGRMETRWDTDWRWVHDQFTFSRSYSPTQYPDLQVYASYKYRRGFVNPIRGASIADATQLSPSMLDPSPQASEYQTVRKVDPYTMRPTIAQKFIQAAIQSNEEAAADLFLRETYRADRTRLVRIELEFEDFKLYPVYLPAYVYTIRYLGRKFRTIINGNDLLVGGQRMYDWNKISVATALGTSSFMLLSGGLGGAVPGGLTGAFWLGIVAPVVVASLLTLYYPILSLYARDLWRQAEMRAHAQEPDSRWDTDWIHAYSAYEEQARYRAWQQEQQYGGGYREKFGYEERESMRRSGGDPKGYYGILGVTKDASKEEIQSAFRGLAMKHHPDRYSTPKEKEAAKVKFQQISAAYSVLRDPQKRRQYDTTGQG